MPALLPATPNPPPLKNIVANLQENFERTAEYILLVSYVDLVLCFCLSLDSFFKSLTDAPEAFLIHNTWSGSGRQ